VESVRFFPGGKNQDTSVFCKKRTMGIAQWLAKSMEKFVQLCHAEKRRILRDVLNSFIFWPRVKAGATA